MKKILKLIRFYMVWGLAAPLVLLYLIGAALFSGQWRLMWIKLELIHMSLYQRFVTVNS